MRENSAEQKIPQRVQGAQIKCKNVWSKAREAQPAVQLHAAAPDNSYVTDRPPVWRPDGPRLSRGQILAQPDNLNQRQSAGTSFFALKILPTAPFPAYASLHS